MVKLVHNKFNFAFWKSIYKDFQEEDILDILMEMMRLLETEIILIQTKEIIIVDLDYNAFSSNQVEKRIFCIE